MITVIFIEYFYVQKGMWTVSCTFKVVCKEVKLRLDGGGSLWGLRLIVYILVIKTTTFLLLELILL